MSTTGSITSAAPAPDGSTTALNSLSGNFSNFLGLLMTQLQNQDPTSPLDANQFTTELVQFSGVAQQITTNSSLTKLIQLTQGSEVLQSSALLGKQVQVAADHLSLQGGKAGIDFNATVAGPAQVVISDDKGNQVASATVAATVGANTWHWDGSTEAGGHAADGAYRVAVTTNDANGSATTLPYTVLGTATGVVTDGSVVQLQIGALTTPFSTVRSVGN